MLWLGCPRDAILSEEFGCICKYFSIQTLKEQFMVKTNGAKSKLILKYSVHEKRRPKAIVFSRCHRVEY